MVKRCAYKPPYLSHEGQCFRRAVQVLLTMFFNKTGTSLPRKGRKISGLRRSGCDTAASQNADQNSQDSSATPSSPLCRNTPTTLDCVQLPGQS